MEMVLIRAYNVDLPGETTDVSSEEEGWVICHIVIGIIWLVADTGWLASAWSWISC